MSEAEEPAGDLPWIDQGRPNKVVPTPSSGSRSDANVEIPRDIKYLAGIGPQRAESLKKLGVHRPIDLLFYFPRSYQEPAVHRPTSQWVADQRCSAVGEVESIEVRSTAEGRTILGVLLRCEGGGYLRLVWFNQPFRRDQLARGMRVLATGVAKSTGVHWEMRHPDFLVLGPDSQVPQGKPIPIYGLTDGIQQRHLMQSIDQLLPMILPSIEEVLPDQLRQQHQLMEIHQALRTIHQPESMEEAELARRRFIFQELLHLQLAIGLRRSRLSHQQAATPLPTSAVIDARIFRRFPFELTGDQRRAIHQIADDMARTTPMNRLIQGDVGSGKTAVALYAMLLAVANEHQAALMAPTEVLARQHFQKLQESLQGSRVHIDLLVGSLTASQRQEVLQRMALGTTDLVVGTQALASDQVAFAKLGLVVIDEQHKFGVEQRASLRGGEQAAHYLVLSATPIPRTLTMTAFGDLDVSILRDKPPGRMPVHSYLAKPDQESSWWHFVAKQVDQGRQAYVIAARVSQSDEEGLQGAQQVYQHLQEGPLKHLALGLLHGRMEGSEKQTTLDQFASGSIDVLVATTVVEVGIDVPNATVMTILDADRLGLSQLHQLRGRVSRGSFPGYVCLMVRQSLAQQENQRLEAFIASDDGFQLAEVDWKLRGPGDLLGTRQHGLPQFRIADLIRDQAVVETTQTAARAILQADPLLDAPQWARLKKQVLARHGQSLDFGDVG
jgi:ATP-dependent DNA helicase RecG